MEKISPGSDSRHNWRTINQCIDHLAALRSLTSQSRDELASLQRRPRDIGGSLQCYRIKSKSGDVLTCRAWDGTAEGTADVQVAVNRKSRQITNEVIGDSTYAYTAYTAVDDYNHERNSNDGTTNETQIVTPMWYLNDVIDVASTPFSGVSAGGEDLKLIEISPRCWAAAAVLP